LCTTIPPGAPPFSSPHSASLVPVILVALIWPLVSKLFFFDWPPLYEWQQARRPLRPTDQWRVIWATDRNHPAGRATLADAQLAYARYRQTRARRALNRRRPGWRVGALVLQGIVVAGFAALAAAHSEQRVFYTLLAAGNALGAVGNVLESSRSLPRATRQARSMVGGRTRYFDNHYESFGVVVELDGQIAHPLEARWTDIHRDNASATAGIITLRYSWADVTMNPCRVASEIAAVLQSRGWTGHPHPCSPDCQAVTSMITEACQS
jgi:hypothetical protein